jgi:hypothetical protein
MKLTLEPTDRFETINGQPHRIWKGTTDGNIPVLAYIRAVSPQTHDPEANALFDRELKALPPGRRELVSFDLRLAVD